jgi:predicted dehydrogenase
MAKGKGGGRPIRVGVVGVGRGRTFMKQAPHAGMELVAVCDRWEEKLRQCAREWRVAGYVDYAEFLSHDMDGVVLANYFHEHAPFAIQALQAGKHVMSECAACNTLAEGVELCRTVEKTGLIYMFAENYPYTAPNQELARLYRAGEIGEVIYAEGEYIHPMSPEQRAAISPGLGHWRNRCPSTYYCTHSLAPLMAITDTMPVAVNALAMPRPASDTRPWLYRNSDAGSVTLCRMDNGAVFRLVHGGMPGHSIWYRVHGVRGLIETVRGQGYWGPGTVRIAHEEYDLQDGQEREWVYRPEFPDWARQAADAGHGGGDFFTNHYFAEAVRTDEPPYLDVYRAVAMSCVGVLAWKSALANGAPLEMPDFRSEASRAPFAEDRWSPWSCQDGPERPPFLLRGQPEINPQGLALAQSVWKKNGYDGE